MILREDTFWDPRSKSYLMVVHYMFWAIPMRYMLERLRDEIDDIGVGYSSHNM